MLWQVKAKFCARNFCCYRSKFAIDSASALNRVWAMRSRLASGARSIYAMRSSSRRREPKARLRRGKRFFRGRDLDFLSAAKGGGDFMLPKMAPAHYGAPFMLRSKGRPEIGLCNGAMGRAAGPLLPGADLPALKAEESLASRAALASCASSRLRSSQLRHHYWLRCLHLRPA